MQKVILYHQPGWGDRWAVEEYLRQKGIPYAGKDIRAQLQAYDELVNRVKSRATATLVIDEEVITGFQAKRQRVEELLAQQLRGGRL